MESKVQNTILIGDENDINPNENDNNEDIFETIFNEIKENFKIVDEEEKKQEELNEIKEKEKNIEKEEEKKEKSNSDGMNDFVIVEKPGEKKENDGNKSDENDF